MPTVFWIWLVAFAIFLILEIFTPSMIFLGFAVSALVSGVYGYFYPESYYWQIGIFVIVSGILLPVTRIVAKKIENKSAQIANVDALIGKVGIVTKKIDADLGGQILLEGENWRATADTDIDVQEKVVVLKIVGTRVHVEKKA